MSRFKRNDNETDADYRERLFGTVLTPNAVIMPTPSNEATLEELNRMRNELKSEHPEILDSQIYISWAGKSISYLSLVKRLSK